MSESTQVATRRPSEVGTYGQDAPMQLPDMGPLMELAIEKGVEGVEVLERLTALMERQMDRQAEQALNQAMLAVQRHLDEHPIPARGQVVVSKTGTKKPYPLLEDVQRALAPVCAEHGLSYSFDTEATGKGFTVITRVAHVMGATRETRTTLPLDQSGSKNDVQGVGSTESYGMRYGLIKAFGLARYLHDDDGAGTGRVVDPETEKLTDRQVADLEALAEEVGADVSKFCTYLRVDSLGDLPASRMKEATDALEAKRGRA